MCKKRFWTKDDCKNAARSEWIPGCILPNIILKKLVRDLAEEFTADPDEVEIKIFSITEYEKINVVLIEYVITAIIKAPVMGIYPFCELQIKSVLPTRQRILDAFRGQMSEEQVQACFDQCFTPGKLELFHMKTLKKIFYRLGVPSSDCEACARVLAPPLPIVRGVHKNKGWQRCSDNVVLALMQHDIRTMLLSKDDMVKSLKKYGITENRYLQLKKAKFNPNCLSKTLENKQQIKRMAKAVGHDPAPLLDILIKK